MRRSLHINPSLVSGILIVASATYLATGCSVADVEQKCKEQATIGLKQYQEKRFAEAEQTYFAAAELAKTSANSLQYPLMLRELARSYVAQKKFDKATSALQQAVDYYDELAKTPKNTRFDQSVVDEREYETLASLGEVCQLNNHDIEAKRAYARAIALGDKIVEPPTIAGAVTQNYIKVLEKTGERDLAEQLQRTLDASALTTDEYDERFANAVNMISHSDYIGAEKQFETLELASKGLVGNTSRSGKVQSYLGLMKVIRNSPLEAEMPLVESIRLMTRNPQNFSEICQSYALLGLCKDMKGDTKSGITYYRKAFAVEPFLLPQILMIARDGLIKFGHPQQAQIIVERIKFFGQDPSFKKAPVTALDYVTLSKQQVMLGKPALAKETSIKGLQHLEQDTSLVRLVEMRGAFQLYKRFNATADNELAKRALKQLYLIGNRTPQGRLQLQKVLDREHLPAP